MQRGCAGRFKIAILPQFLLIEPHFVRKGCNRTFRITISPQFLMIEPHFVRRLPRTLENRNLTAGFDDRTSFRAKGWNFTAVLDDRASFRTKESCRGHSKIAILPQFWTIEPHFVRRGCVSWRLIGTAPCLKREIEKKEGEEGKRARGQERGDVRR